ncbi:unnamed protein product [Agarophyton chilense]|eukprot:gb/GEZJ01001813.1/.p2 GENE.gb/GEZJ01001813.1/~~gb/GEZJ01001813.1/.p2  ORF type:complete len:574 (-),score=84.45 gb/GEZJ01001813.1/:5028-6749(-)
MSESDVELDAELSELFDSPAPQQVPPSPPRNAPLPNKRSLFQALRANAHRLSLSAASKEASLVSNSHAPRPTPLAPSLSLAAPSEGGPIESEPHGTSTAAAATAPDKLGDVERKTSPSRFAGGERDPPHEERVSLTSAPISSKELMNKRIAERKAASHARCARTAPAMQIVSAANNTPPSTGKQQFTFHDRQTSNISLRDSPFNAATLQALFEHCTRIDISELALKTDQLRQGSITNPVVYGVVVEKHAKKRAKDGSTYAVWTLYNMPRYQREACSPTSVLLLLFGAAFERWHNVVPGAVFALRRPALLPPRMAERQQVRGVCLKVSTEKQLLYLGVSVDYASCEAIRYDGVVCGKWYDANRTSMCSKHRAEKLKKLTSSNRMDVNNSIRPGTKQTKPTEERKLSSVMPSESENLRQRLSAPRSNKYQQMDKKRIRRLRESRHHATQQSRINTQTEQTTRIRRKQYKNAVFTLQNMGFTLDEHGSLIAPQQEHQTSEYGPLFKRARTRADAPDTGDVAPPQRAPSAITNSILDKELDRQDVDKKGHKTGKQDEPSVALMELSDESTSESDSAT